MSDWTSGYTAEIEYTNGYYSELNPLRMKLAFLSQGLVNPKVINACELGFGKGLTINIHAAASNVNWYGNDFNPSQAADACSLNSTAGSNANLSDNSFQEYLEREDIPNMDFIALHGIWAWVSDANREIISEFINRKLNVGGVVYISYNTQPGWAEFSPIRHLMKEHADTFGAPGYGILANANRAMEFTEKLFSTNPAYLRANPAISKRLTDLKTKKSNYITHEYFNHDWKPMRFKEVADCLSQSKLTYVCSADHLDHIDNINLSEEQRAFLSEIQDPVFSQTIRDFMFNRQFRKEYWVKGPQRISKDKQAESIRELKFVLTTNKSNIELKVKGAQGEATLNQEIYDPIIEFLSDHQPKTFREIEAHLVTNGVNSANLLQAVFMLRGMSHITEVQSNNERDEVKSRTQKLNIAILDKAKESNEINHLASPITGGGLDVNRFQQLFIVAKSQGIDTDSGLAKFAWDILKSQNELIVKEGKKIVSFEDNLEELTQQAKEFSERVMPMLKATGVL